MGFEIRRDGRWLQVGSLVICETEESGAFDSREKAEERVRKIQNETLHDAETEAHFINNRIRDAKLELEKPVRFVPLSRANELNILEAKIKTLK